MAQIPDLNPTSVLSDTDEFMLRKGGEDFRLNGSVLVSSREATVAEVVAGVVQDKVITPKTLNEVLVVEKSDSYINPNFLQNSHFYQPSPTGLTVPVGGSNFNAGDQVFLNWLVSAGGIIGLSRNPATGLINATSGSIYEDVPKSGPLGEYTGALVASWGNNEGQPTEDGAVTFADMGDFYRVTLTPNGCFSAKLEQGVVATRHEGFNSVDDNPYTMILSEAISNPYAKEGDTKEISDLANGKFQYVTGATANGTYIYDHDTLPLQLKLFEFGNVNLKMFGAIDLNESPTYDSTPNILGAYSYVNLRVSNSIIDVDGQFNFTRIPVQSYTTLNASSENSALICTDSTTEDEIGLGFGSAIRKPNDGTRAVMFNITGGLFIGTALSGVSAAEDLNPNLIGLNITASERCNLDFRMGGFGYAGLVTSRAGGGAEGLGYTLTNQDGNHNVIYCRAISWCGKHGPGNAALWLKFSANSNTIISYAKGLDATHFGMPFANNNTVTASTSENVKSVAVFGSLAQDNTIWNPRCELATSDAVVFNAASTGNIIDSGRFTGVVGEFFKGLAGTTNMVRSPSAQKFYHGKRTYPPITSISDEWYFGVHDMTAIGGKASQPLYTVSDVYNDAAEYPSNGLFSTVVALSGGVTIGEHVCYNSDSSTGAAGISGAIRYITEGSAGQTAISLLTGTGTTLTEGWRQSSAQHWNPVVDSAFDIGSTASNRVRDLRIANSPIVGSSYKIKDDLGPIPQELLDFAMTVESRQFRYKTRNRTHFGLIITEDFLLSLGAITDLDMCAAFCRDIFTDEEGNPVNHIINGVELGDLWQIRHDEWQNIMLEAMRRKINAM